MNLLVITTTNYSMCLNHRKHSGGMCYAPKSPSELRPSFRSGAQPPTVLWPGSVRPIIPCFIIPAYSFISPFLIPFLHAFHVSDIRLVYVPHPRSPFRTPNPESHSIPLRITFPLFYFHFLLLIPILCLLSMTLICSLQYLYVQNFMYVSQSEINIDCPL